MKKLERLLLRLDMCKIPRNLTTYLLDMIPLTAPHVPPFDLGCFPFPVFPVFSNLRIPFSPSRFDSNLLSGTLCMNLSLRPFEKPWQSGPRAKPLASSSDRRIRQQWHDVFPPAVQCSARAR